MRRMYSKPQLLEAVEQEAEVNGLKAFENIVDKDGHKRFIEGVIDTSSLPSGITSTYAKWSLSGSHLLIVLCLNVASGTTAPVDNLEVKIPTWVLDKIYQVFGIYIADHGLENIKNGSAQNVGQIATNLNKTAGKLRITYAILTATTQDGFIRIAYDLLIDNE